MTSHKKQANCCHRHAQVNFYRGGVRGNFYTGGVHKQSKTAAKVPTKGGR